LNLADQQELFNKAISEVKQFPGKAVIFVTSAQVPGDVAQRVETGSGGRAAVLDGVADPAQFLVNLFDTGKKVPSPVLRKVHTAVRTAYENAFGQSKASIRQMVQHSLVLAKPNVFEVPNGLIRQVSQQFLFRGDQGDLASLYDAYLRYAIRIGGHLKAAEIDQRLLDNLSVRDNLPGRAGVTEISFTAQGLSRVLSFLQAVAHQRSIQTSA